MLWRPGSARRSRVRSPLGDQVEFGAGRAVVLNLLGAKIGLGAAAEGQHAPARHFAEARHPRIVRIQNRDGLGTGQTFDQFAFGQRDFVDGSEKLQVHRRHARDHAHLGLGNLGQTPQFAAMRHAQFHHRGLVFRFQPQQRERQAVFVVQIALGLQDAEFRAQQRRQNLFRGCLSDGACDRGDAPPPGAPNRLRQLLQRGQRIADGNEPSANFRGVGGDALAGHDGGFRSRLQSSRHEIVSIVSRAADSDKQLPSAHRARINRDAGQPRQGGEPRGNCDTQRVSNLLNRPPHIVLSGFVLTALPVSFPIHSPLGFLNRHSRAGAKSAGPLPDRRRGWCAP